MRNYTRFTNIEVDFSHSLIFMLIRRFSSVLAFATVAVMLTAFRCPGPDPVGDGDPEVGGGGPGGAPGGGGAGGSEACVSPPDEDNDQDGWTGEEGDCDDCEAAVNPGAVELQTLPGDEAFDDNCDGEIDEVPNCEPDSNNVAVTPLIAAHTIELCDDAADDLDWGLLETRFVRADGIDYVPGDAAQIALDDKFGAVLSPRVGKRLLVLSTGVARDASQQNACATESCGNPNSQKPPPPGFPVGLPGCAPSMHAFDDVALEVVIRPPPNAGGFAFHTAYLTHEYPEAVCSPYRDQFLALLTPTPPNWPTANMVFDAAGIPPSVSFTPFPHCDPETVGAWSLNCFDGCPEPPSPYCPQGPALLADTGFNVTGGNGTPTGGASTGWLETRVPLTSDDPIEIRFLLFDTDDHLRDSTVLIDGFTWLGQEDLGELPATEVE
jgi:hypothetical protein